MSEIAVDPVFWTRRGIISLGPQVIQELVRRSAATVHAYKLVVGRCLLAIDETGLHETEGYSSAIHYAVCVLGLKEKDAQGYRRVAFCLESLPLLTRAAELGQVAWGKLSEIVRKANAETEAAWLAIASKKNCREIEKLVRSTEYGKLPWDEDQEPESPVTRVTMNLNAEMAPLLERVVHSISQTAGRPLSKAEVIEQLLVEHLAKRPIDPEVLEAAREQARRGVAAHKMRNARLIEEARDLAQELGWNDQVDPLQAALGGEIMTDDSKVEAHFGDSSTWEKAVGIDSPACSMDSDKVEREAGQRSTHVGWTAVTKATPKARTAEPEMSGATDATAEATSGAADAATPERSQQSAHVIGCPGDAAVQHEGWMNRRLRYNPRARSATPAQRLELLMRDGHRCRTPGCPHRLWLELHHRVYFSKNGKTTRANLLSLCSRCHSNEQKGLLIIGQDAQGRLTFKNSKGENLQRAYVTERANWLNFWIGWSGGPDDFHRPTTDFAEDPAVIIEVPMSEELAEFLRP